MTGATATYISGSPDVLTSGTIGAKHTYADDGKYTVTVTLHDDNGGSASGQFTVTVKNVPPVVIAADNQTYSRGKCSI